MTNQGSVCGLLDPAGTISASYSYDAYGKQMAGTGSSATPFGFTGQYTGAKTGFQYL